MVQDHGRTDRKHRTPQRSSRQTNLRSSLLSQMGRWRILTILQRYRYQVSISPTFHEQLLQMQILKAQKIQSSRQCLFALLGSVRVKAFCKHVGEIDPRRRDPIYVGGGLIPNGLKTNQLLSNGRFVGVLYEMSVNKRNVGLWNYLENRGCRETHSGVSDQVSINLQRTY